AASIRDAARAMRWCRSVTDRISRSSRPTRRNRILRLRCSVCAMCPRSRRARGRWRRRISARSGSAPRPPACPSLISSAARVRCRTDRGSSGQRSGSPSPPTSGCRSSSSGGIQRCSRPTPARRDAAWRRLRCSIRIPLRCGVCSTRSATRFKSSRERTRAWPLRSTVRTAASNSSRAADFNDVIGECFACHSGTPRPDVSDVCYTRRRARLVDGLKASRVIARRGRGIAPVGMSDPHHDASVPGPIRTRSMSTPFVSQLAELCRTDITRTKWVIVPTHAVGRTLGERLTREGTNWVNLRFVTPLDLATRMGAPFLVERGIDPSEDGLGPALMMRLLMQLPEQDGYFRPLADQPSMGEALWSAVRELRAAGLTSGDIPSEAFTSPAKHRELVALQAAYETFLATEKRGDQATVYEEALRHGDWCPIGAADCWIETPDVFWTVLQRRLLDALPGTRLTPRACAIDGAGLPRRLEGVSVTREAQPVRRDAIDLFHAAGREAEIEEVFRRIQASGASLDDVEIACGSESG